MEWISLTSSTLSPLAGPASLPLGLSPLGAGPVKLGNGQTVFPGLTVTPTPTPSETPASPSPEPTVTVTVTETAPPTTLTGIVTLEAEQFTGLTVGLVLLLVVGTATFVAQMKRP